MQWVFFDDIIKWGDDMKSWFSLKEQRRHGSKNYPFEKYNIISDRTKQFATNHWHNETEIIFVSKGRINITINHNSFVGNPGDIFIINSCEMHEIYGSGTPLEYSAFVFDFNMLSFRKDDLVQQKFLEPVLNGKVAFFNKIKHSADALAMLRHINEINTQKSGSYMLQTKAVLLQLFALLIEQEQLCFIKEAPPNDEKTQILKDIVAFINEKYAEKIALSDIAEHFHMSHKYFCRFFKNNFSKTFVEYLNDVRIENSVRLLTQKNISVTEAAISCGFCNMSYFAHTFKKKLGCTPSQYKKLPADSKPSVD